MYYIHVTPGGTNNSPTQQILLSGTIIIHCATMFASDWGTVYHDNYALMIGGFRSKVFLLLLGKQKL